MNRKSLPSLRFEAEFTLVSLFILYLYLHKIGSFYRIQTFFLNALEFLSEEMLLWKTYDQWHPPFFNRYNKQYFKDILKLQLTKQHY